MVLSTLTLFLSFFRSSDSGAPSVPKTEQVSSPIDPQREAARTKREHRRERDREHHRESRGSTQRSSHSSRSQRESSVPHEQEYAISTKGQPRQSNKSRERSRGSGSRGHHENNERPLSHHEIPGINSQPMQGQTTELNLEPCKSLLLETTILFNRKRRIFRYLFSIKPQNN